MIKFKFLYVFVFCLFFIFNINSENFKIAVANLYANNKNEQKVTSELLSLDSDVIILLEYTNNIILENFGNYNFILNEPMKGVRGILILLKKGYDAKSILIESPFKSQCSFPFGTMRLSLNNINISIIAVHIPPPVKGCAEGRKPTIKEVKKWIKDGRLVKDIGVCRKGDFAIVAGDFNSLPQEKIMRDFKKRGMIDSAVKSNFTLEGTWSMYDKFPKIFRIDYIFVSKHLNLVHSDVFSVPGSDHRGVIAQIKTKDKADK